jgi:hypothetical protein
MRRNVRRLNREVGNIGGREMVPETHSSSNMAHEEQEETDKGDGTKKNSKSRKAVNLAGLSSSSLPPQAMFQN